MPKPCDEEQVYNPETKRCIGMKNPKVKSLIEKHVKGEIVLSEEDKKKLLAFKSTAKLALEAFADSKDAKPPSPFKSAAKQEPKKEEPKKEEPKKTVAKKDPVIKNEISTAMKAKVKDALARARKRLDERYYSPIHKKYCDASDEKRPSILREPVVTKTYTLSIPVYAINTARIGDHMKDPDLRKTEHYLVVRSDMYKMSVGFDSHNQKWKMREMLETSTSSPELIYEGMDLDWIYAQNEYIKNLPLRSLFTVLGYSHVGDVLVNNYHRGRLNESYLKSNLSIMAPKYFPLFYQWVDEVVGSTYSTVVKGSESTTVTITTVSPKPKSTKEWLDIIKIGKIDGKDLTDYQKYVIMQHIGSKQTMFFWKAVVHRYSKELSDIINKSPKLKKPFIVYRGVKDDYYLNGNKQATNKKYLKGKTPYYINQGFVSTSMNPLNAYNFTNQKGQKLGATCCFKRIRLLPGTRCMLLMGLSHYQEMEILLGYDSVYLIRQKKPIRNYIMGHNINYCYKEVPHYKVYISDIVVVK